MRSPHTRPIAKAALTAALLALTSLTLLPSAQAQNLTLGDVSDSTASGTATLTDAGTTASGTYSYDYGNGTPLSQQTSYDTWATYGTSTTDISGGSIYLLQTFKASTANVSGGSIGEFEFYSSGTASISGGSIFNFETFDPGSTANISGGNLTILETFNTSTANVSGGDLASLYATNASTVNVSGGSISNLYTYDNSTANVSGGSISTIYTYDTSILNLFGTGFTQTLVDAPASMIAGAESTFTQYEVKGTLQDGTMLDASYYDYGGTLLFTNAVPEASSVVSFGLLLVLGFGRFALRRRCETIAV